LGAGQGERIRSSGREREVSRQFSGGEGQGIAAPVVFRKGGTVGPENKKKKIMGQLEEALTRGCRWYENERYSSKPSLKSIAVTQKSRSVSC